jgi:hypothetical protein
MDRGYPSRALLAQLCAQGVKFCVRLPNNWTVAQLAMRGRVADQICDMGTPDAPLRLRVLRHALPNGRILVVATNLEDSSLNASQFADLYRSRWRIEECFKLLKARLQVENWSGVLPHTVEQDFYAAIVRVNCAAVLALHADPSHACLLPAEPDSKGWRKALNCTLVIKSLRHMLPRLVLSMDIEGVIERIIARLRSPASKERTRPNRSAPRDAGVRLAGFHFAYKAA